MILRTRSLQAILAALAFMKPCSAHVNLLIQCGTIATWNDTSQAIEVYRRASLLIKGDTISRIYKELDHIPAGVYNEVVDASNKIIVPGFVNTHHHVWQTLYKTLAADLPFAAYFPRLGPLALISSTLSPDDVYQSELMGALELLNEGTTSWVDVTPALSPETVEASWRANLASGGRSFFAATVQPRDNFSEDSQISQIQSLAMRPELRNQSLVTLGLSYDGFDGSTSESRSNILHLVHSTNLSFITTHYVGGPFGNTNSPELLNRPEWSLLNGTLPILFGHASFVTPLDASLLRKTNQYISTTPESEQHFGQGNTHAHLIQDQTALAADTTVGFSTSLVNQARMWLQQVRSRLSQLVVDQWSVNTNTPMTVNQAFYLATRAGGLALRRPDLGVIAEGAKADLVLYDTTKPNLVGWRDPVVAVILYSNPGDVSDVLVGGSFVKKNYALTFKGLASLTRQFEQSAVAFENRYRSYDFKEGTHWFPLAAYKDAQEVDVVRGNAT